MDNCVVMPYNLYRDFFKTGSIGDNHERNFSFVLYSQRAISGGVLLWILQKRLYSKRHTPEHLKKVCRDAYHIDSRKYYVATEYGERLEPKVKYMTIAEILLKPNSKFSKKHFIFPNRKDLYMCYKLLYGWKSDYRP